MEALFSWAVATGTSAPAEATRAPREFRKRGAVLCRVVFQPNSVPVNDLANWTKKPTPGEVALQGPRVRLEPLRWDEHGEGLFAAVGGHPNAGIWEWMPMGPWLSADELHAFLRSMRENSENWRTMVIRGRSGEVLGMASYMRIRESHGSAEIGCVAFGSRLRRTTEATEALALMARHIFDLGYRRYEWKCNNGNAASGRAALRFGYTYEGTFRNDMVAKGKSRDTAWYSIVDTEWPAVRDALECWLDPGNFSPDGFQLRTLESFRRSSQGSRTPAPHR